MRKFFWAREITVDTAFRSCAAMGTYLSTHAIASQAQSRCLNGNLTRLDSAATPRAVFLNLFWDSRFKITAKRASLVLRVEFGDRRIGKANRQKGQRPFFILFRNERSEFLSRRVKLGFRRWLWIENAMACVLSVRTHCVFNPKRRIKPDFTRPSGGRKNW